MKQWMEEGGSIVIVILAVVIVVALMNSAPIKEALSTLVKEKITEIGGAGTVE
ncbi:MAG: hypothetical protein WBO70_00865 [Erysipelotrichaceae bacterium]